MDEKNVIEDYYAPFELQKRRKLNKVQIAVKEAYKNRKLKFSWHGPEESKLVLGVQKRPALWDSGDPAYKIPSIKNECWEMIVDELGIENIDCNEAKNKWNSMRSNFKAYLGKFRSRKSNQTAADIENVTWPHFKEMLFLESVEVQSISSMSTIDFEDASTTDETSFFNSYSESTDIKPSKPPNPPIFRPRRKRPSCSSSTATPSPSPSPSPQPLPSHPKELALKVLNNLHEKMQSIQYNDHFSAFGEVIAGNMRKLKSDEATELEILLSRVMYDYLNSVRSTSSRTEDSCRCIYCRRCRLSEKHR